MTKRDILISLCSFLCLGDGVKPLSNNEFDRFNKKLEECSLDLNTLTTKNGKELLIALFGQKEHYEEKEIHFVERIDRLLGRLPSIQFDILDLSKWGIHILTILDENYPSKIKDTLKEKSPVLLYYSGDLTLLEKNFIGFVGSRNIDDSDSKYIDEWVKLLVKENYGIVSGGAHGVDTQSVFSAIDNSGYAIEFLSDSMIKRIRNPKINKAIRERKVLLLSESIPSASFNVGFAMARNKYIYLLSNKTIVIKVEYQVKNKIKTGGTWNGAIENLKSDYKRVYCRDNGTLASKELISYGAIPIKSVTDVNSVSTILEKTERENKIGFPIGKEVFDFIDFVKRIYREKYESLFSLHEGDDLEKMAHEIIIDFNVKSTEVATFTSYINASIGSKENSATLYGVIADLLKQFTKTKTKKRTNRGEFY